MEIVTDNNTYIVEFEFQNIYLIDKNNNKNIIILLDYQNKYKKLLKNGTINTKKIYYLLQNLRMIN